MSAFLKFESYLVQGLVASIAHKAIKKTLNENQWQILHDSSDFYVAEILGNYATKERAFDGDTSAAATSGNVYPKWIGAKLNAPAKILTLGLVCHTNPPTYSPKNFTVDWSDDNLTWTTAASFTDVKGWYYSYQRLFFAIPPTDLPHLYWRVHVTAGGGNEAYIDEIEFYNENMAPAFFEGPDTRSYFDVIPPASESIGDSKSRGIVRFEFTKSEITIRPIYQTLIPRKQVIAFWNGVDGNVKHSVTIFGETIAQADSTLSASNTAYVNLRALFDALKKATTPKAIGFDWRMENKCIYGFVKDYNTSLSPSSFSASTGVKSYLVGEYVPAMWRLPYLLTSKLYKHPVPPTTLPITIYEGFVYYLQVCSRGLALGVKTSNTGFIGPVHVCYANNAKAREATPKTEYASPIELFVGNSKDSLFPSIKATTTHTWGVNNAIPPTAAVADVDESAGHPTGRLVINFTVQDVMKTDAITMSASKIWKEAADAGYAFKIHRVSSPGVTMLNADNNGMSSSARFTNFAPAVELPDWYKIGSVSATAPTNESLMLVADNLMTTALVTPNIAPGDTVNSLDVVSAANLPAAGQVCINGEVFSYTGVSGNTLTGVTRAQYLSPSLFHYAGDIVQPCSWVMVMNGGAILCGPVKPS